MRTEFSFWSWKTRNKEQMVMASYWLSPDTTDIMMRDKQCTCTHVSSGPSSSSHTSTSIFNHEGSTLITFTNPKNFLIAPTLSVIIWLSFLLLTTSQWGLNTNKYWTGQIMSTYSFAAQLRVMKKFVRNVELHVHTSEWARPVSQSFKQYPEQDWCWWMEHIVYLFASTCVLLMFMSPHLVRSFLIFLLW